MACGNGKVSRSYLASQPSAPVGDVPKLRRPESVPPKRLAPHPRAEPLKVDPPQESGPDTSVDSPDRVWEMKGVVRYKGEFLEERGAHVYFGGLGEADGPGHGHGFIDDDGKFTVFRDPYDPAGGKSVRRAATHEYVPPVNKKK